MKKNVREELKQTTDHFAVFKKTALTVFDFLITDYGCELVSIFAHMPECAIKFRNETTGIEVHYEWEAEIWIVLERLKRKGMVERIGLDYLAMKCCPQRVVRQKSPFSNDEIERILNDYANLLKECAKNILEGDFQVFPEIIRFAEAIKKQREKELYGE
jgi:hypothetical protein